MKTITSEEMRILDANSAWFGVPVQELMENAGRAVAAEANKLGDSFVIVCGPGNNGGDGFAAARYLKSKPRIFYLGRPRSNEAYDNFIKAKNYRPVQLNDKILPDLTAALSKTDVVIDALFGTGMHGKIREPVRTIIQEINKSGKKILSVDVPSGMDPDTGKSDLAVKPTLTVFLHAAKGKAAKGKSVVADIGIHPDSADFVGKGDFKFRYPQRKENAHKGQSGRVLTVGGSNNYTGAPYFAAMAALKAGCDLAYVAAPRVAAERIASMGPEIIVYPLDSESNISEDDVKPILSHKFDVLCIGNGLGDSKSALNAAKKIISTVKKPMVVDGDALKAIKDILPKLGANVILTPHAQEFKRLFGLKPTDKNVQKVSKKYKFTVLSKGPVDIIANKKSLKYNKSGNPHMAKGGTGDVLAGLCAGFLAQGTSPFDSACFAALLNGVAGDIAYSEESIALTASDVLSRIGMAAKILLV
jgi:NAD(P)H-hydrate epimerase